MEFRNGLWFADWGLITLSVVMEDMQVDEIARKSMEIEKRAEKKNPWALAFETALYIAFLPTSVFRPMCAVD